MTTSTTTKRWIPEIQGLRTVALLLVATFHVWVGRVSGGVDIFLLVSAYLMTGSLTRAAERGTRPSVPTFVIKKFARLLPVAGAAIALTVIAALLLLPSTELVRTIQDGTAALFYFENFHLQQQAVDYYAQEQASKSLFQHFWSLSVQGQVFIIWPLIHLAAYQWSHATKQSIRNPLRVIFGLIFLGSLTWSIIYTAQAQTLAYFDTWTRLWEFAAGSLLALLPPLTAPGWLRSILGLIGLLGVFACGFVLPVESSFPGWAALWPVVSAALIIVSAGDPTPFGADRLLTLPVLTTLGGYTYALYLTHWPVLVLFSAVTGVEQPSFLQGTAILTVAGALSWVLVHTVERPFATWLKKTTTVDPDLPKRNLMRRLIGPTAVALTGAMIAGSTLSICELKRQSDDARFSQAIADSDFSRLGAEYPEAPLTDSPLPDGSMLKDQEIFHGEACTDFTVGGPSQEVCQELHASPDDPLFVAIGNSHSERLTNIVLEASELSNTPVNVRSHALPGCEFQYVDDPEEASCAELWQISLDHVKAHQPAAVLVVGTHSELTPAEETTFSDLPRWITDLKSVSPDTDVIVVRDTPRFDFVPYDCAQKTSWDDESCVGEYKPENLEDYITEVESAGGYWVDVNNKICPHGQCSPQLGTLVTYYDTNHLTAPFMRSLTPSFSAQLKGKSSQWPQPA